MSRSTQINILNFVLFQIGWFACVLGAANGQGWLGVYVVLILAVIHISIANRKLQEIPLLLSVGLIGFAWESILASQDLLVYPAELNQSNLAPIWMAALWINFATTLNLSLGWLKSRKVLAAGIAGIAGPLAYYAGVRLGALDMPNLTLSIITLAVGWSLLFPLGLMLAERFNGFTAKEAQHV